MSQTAEALTAEALTQDPTPPAQEAPEAPSTDDEMAAVWDKMQTQPEEVEDTPPEEPEPEKAATDEPSEEPAEPEEKPKAAMPSDIPRQLRPHWDKLPDDARTSIEDFSRETNRKMSEQGRMMNGISPIRDALAEAVKDFPQMADMKPQDVAKEVFQLAKVSAEFNSNPVKTMLGLIEKHGLKNQMAQVLQGQPVVDEVTPLKQELADVKRKLAQATDPESIREQVKAITAVEATMSEVQKFAASAEHWVDVEDKLPAYVQFMRDEMGQDASAKDVLKAAYDLAVSRVVPPEPKALDDTADQAVDVVDPEKAKAALKAKSVNVRSQPSKARTLTEDELLSATFDKAQKR